jgi:hypothetical protein
MGMTRVIRLRTRRRGRAGSHERKRLGEVGVIRATVDSEPSHRDGSVTGNGHGNDTQIQDTRLLASQGYITSDTRQRLVV